MTWGAYLVFGRGIDPRVGARVARAAAAIEAAPPAWLLDWIPSYDRIFVEYDPRRVDVRSLAAWARSLEAGEGREGRHVEIPVRYGGLDLPEIAERAGLSPEEVVRLHAGVTYRVYAVGFTPGFPFMAEVPEPLRLPRRAVPRKRVPAHAVGIAGVQTGIYPQESPGGWNLLGRTLVRVYDPHRERPFLLEPGDRVRFVPQEGEPPGPPEAVELLEAGEGAAVLEVLEPGWFTLPVDGGRFRAGRFGLARSGPLDARSLGVANRLLGNPPSAPALELNLAGPLLEALQGVTVALALQDAHGRMQAWTRLLRRGERLDLRALSGGTRGYLAVPGGLALGRFMGSASPDLKGRIGRPLAPGDRLRARAAPDRLRRTGRAWRHDVRADAEVVLRLRPGPQAEPEALEALLRGRFRVAAADRMGVRLEGARVPGGEVTSEGVPLGAVQVPPGGAPMLLLADRGTIGGYAKPAVLHPADLARAGQLREGDRLRFVLDPSAQAYAVLDV